MKLLLCAAGLLVLAPAVAQAQQEVRREERVVVMAGAGAQRLDIPEGGLTREAFEARHGEMFARLDADSNGVVTREEMAAMAAAHGGGAGRAMVFHGDGAEEVELDGNGEWTSEDGSRHVVVRRRGPGDEPLEIEWENTNVEGGEGGQRRIVIRRRGPDGETVDVHEEPGEGGERHVMVFRHGAEGGLDADGDGRWSFDEMAAPLREHFNHLDANHDGFVDEAERRH